LKEAHIGQDDSELSPLSST